MAADDVSTAGSSGQAKAARSGDRPQVAWGRTEAAVVVVAVGFVASAVEA